MDGDGRRSRVTNPGRRGLAASMLGKIFPSLPLLDLKAVERDRLGIPPYVEVVPNRAERRRQRKVGLPMTRKVMGKEISFITFPVYPPELVARPRKSIEIVNAFATRRMLEQPIERGEA